MGSKARRDPWAKAPVGELNEQLLPRWFVLLAVALVPVVVVVAVLAFFVFSPPETPVAARRPPPGPGLTSDVGELIVGEAEPVAYEAACPGLAGVRIAGTDSDRALLRQAIAGLCNTSLDPDTTAALEAFASAGGVIRFALFEVSVVDSTADLGEPPRILLNAKFAQMARPRWIAPVIAHDAVVLAGDPHSAETALRAREVEADVCRRLLGGEEPSRGCVDAEELLALPEPVMALREQGFR